MPVDCLVGEGEQFRMLLVGEPRAAEADERSRLDVVGAEGLATGRTYLRSRSSANSSADNQGEKIAFGQDPH